MASERLVAYVREALRRGYSERLLKETLLREGWLAPAVDEAIAEALGSAPVTRPTIAGKIGGVLRNPTGLFRSVQEEGVTSAFLYAALLLLVPAAVTGAFPSFMPLPALGEYVEGFGLGEIGLPLFLYAGSLVALVLSAAVAHVLVAVLGGRGGYASTWRSLTYGSTPSLLGGWIPVANIAFGVWSAYLVVKGLAIQHQISQRKALAALLLPPAAVAAGLLALGLLFPLLGLLSL